MVGAFACTSASLSPSNVRRSLWPTITIAAPASRNIEAAMQPGVSKTVKLKEVIPVVLFYGTAMSDQTGRALFSEDIYKLDPALELALKMRK